MPSTAIPAGPLCWTISQRSVCRRKATGVSKSNSSPNFKSNIVTQAFFKKSVGFDGMSLSACPTWRSSKSVGYWIRSHRQDAGDQLVAKAVFPRIAQADGQQNLDPRCDAARGAGMFARGQLPEGIEQGRIGDRETIRCAAEAEQSAGLVRIVGKLLDCPTQVAGPD